MLQNSQLRFLLGIFFLHIVACYPQVDLADSLGLDEEELNEIERRSRAPEGSIEEYMQTCGITFQMGVRKKVKFTSPFYGTDKAYPPKTTCKWDFIGDEQCISELTCKTFDVSPVIDGDCDQEHLRVSDGIGSQETMCGHKSFAVPIRASKGTRDLYVSFKSAAEPTGKYKGFSCQVSCSKNPSAAKDLAATDDARKEEFGCICGLRNMDDRIVGGEDVSTMAEFPWQAAVVFKGTRQPKCGASVINNRYILTAAHCFVLDQTTAADVEVLIHAQVLDAATMEGSSAKVALGGQGSLQAPGYKDRRRTDKDENTKRYTVAEVITHPLFTDKYDYDAALLKLSTRIDLKNPDSPTPVCLPDAENYSRTYERQNPWVVGWGLADEHAGGTTRRLQKLSVPVISVDKCKKWMPYNITPRMLCAGFEQGSKDACMGDSGGPLINKKPNQQWEQIGIVSWGEGCARAHRPGVYSRVTDLNQWIRHHASPGATWCRDNKTIPDKK